MDGERRRAFLRGLRTDEVLPGVVSRIEDFGVFVELGGVEGMINASQLTWRPYDRLSDVVTVGEGIRVTVLDVDHDRERISLSAKNPRPA
ncbi:S1 RNA-binding domain-containing protein [Streptomyces sp. NPDC053431]|uniref:S1 RNA-binding domain-containing protein n=1 Tax=Streptomyces sp. NPDC053431 TaxID=3365703 RepID=UPI0037D7C7C7